MTVDSTCWSCGRRPAVRGAQALVQLRRDERFVYFVVGTYQRYRRMTVAVPRCQECRRAWAGEPVARAIYQYTRIGTGCLVVPLLVLGLITAIAVNAYWSFLYAGVVLAAATLIAGPARWYLHRHPPKALNLRPPREYPLVLELIQQGWMVQN